MLSIVQVPPAKTTKKNKRTRPTSAPVTQQESKLGGCNKRAKKSSNRKSNATVTDASGNVGGKINGLRLFSKLVCQKLEEKQITSYSEVADELVAETLSQRDEDAAGNIGANVRNGTTMGKKKSVTGCHDDKNIRRRVYDALNVLDALNVISKVNKEIRWNGLPSKTSVDLKKIQKERNDCLAGVEKKRELLQDLVVQHICFRNLIMRNAKKKDEIPLNRNARAISSDDEIPLPFIVVSTSSNSTVQVDMNEDQTELVINFDKPFEMNDNNSILRRLDLDKITRDDLSKIIPPDIIGYCTLHKMLDSSILPISELTGLSTVFQGSNLQLENSAYPYPVSRSTYSTNNIEPEHSHPGYRATSQGSLPLSI